MSFSPLNQCVVFLLQVLLLFSDFRENGIIINSSADSTPPDYKNYFRTSPLHVVSELLPTASWSLRSSVCQGALPKNGQHFVVHPDSSARFNSTSPPKSSPAESTPSTHPPVYGPPSNPPPLPPRDVQRPPPIHGSPLAIPPPPPTRAVCTPPSEHRNPLPIHKPHMKPPLLQALPLPTPPPNNCMVFLAVHV